MSIFGSPPRSEAPYSVILIRVMVGAVFLSEGIQKFRVPGNLALGGFTKMGAPYPEVMGPFVGNVESVCGMLVLLGLLTCVGTGSFEVSSGCS